MSLPPIAPPPAAAPRPQPRKQHQPSSSPVAAPRKAAAAAAAAPVPLSPAKPPRKGRGAPLERAGPFSSSWPSASLQKQVPRGRAAPGDRHPPPPQAAAAASPGPAPSGAWRPPSRGRSPWGPPDSAAARSCESLSGAPGGRGEAALRFSLSLPPEAIRVLQRRSLEKEEQQRQQQRRRRQRGLGLRSASPDAARRPLAGGPAAGGDLRALLQVSLLNERHRYDDVEYEEDEAAAAAAAGGAPGAPAADEGLVRKCTEWLRGVESAAARDRAAKLDSLPHLTTL